MSESYGQLVTRLCQLRDELRTTEPGRQALASVRDQLKEMVKAQRAAGGGILAARGGTGTDQSRAGRRGS